MKVQFTVMIQKQTNNRRRGRAHNHQEPKGAAGMEFNKEHATTGSFIMAMRSPTSLKHRVSDNQQHGYRSPSSLLAVLSPL
jgi:hypothetical protein